jgi:tRNA nucleotidyltransferase (CCA-adding enzyme)
VGRGGNQDQGPTPSRAQSRAEDWRAQVRGGVAELIAGAPGAEAWEVGGSIRDELLGLEAKDLDVCVVGLDYEALLARASAAGSADPLETAGQLIGVRLTAPWTPKEGIELALARTEASTGPAHSDFAYEFSDKSIDEDLGRRDFTCNAIARRINADGTPGEIIDPFGGVDDIDAGILRQAHPHALDEDPLRTLRGLVRVSRDGLMPDAETAEAMRRNAAALAPEGPLSAERKIEQLDKLLAGNGAAEALRLARNLGVYEQVFPELKPTIGFEQESRYHSMSVDEHCLQALQRACEFDAPLSVRWAALLHDSGKPATAWRGADGRLHYYANPDDPESREHEVESAEITRAMLERLRATRRFAAEVEFLVSEHMYGDDNEFERRSQTKKGIKARRFLARVGRDRAEALMLLRRCDRAGKVRELEPGWDRELQAFEERVRAEWNKPLTLKELEINGHDISELGLKGPGVGKVLAELRHRVVCDPDSNQRERLLGWAESLARAEGAEPAAA